MPVSTRSAVSWSRVGCTRFAVAAAIAAVIHGPPSCAHSPDDGPARERGRRSGTRPQERNEMATVAPSTRGGRLRRMRGALTRREWAGVAGMVGVVAGLHIVGWVTLLVLVV